MACHFIEPLSESKSTCCYLNTFNYISDKFKSENNNILQWIWNDDCKMAAILSWPQYVICSIISIQDSVRDVINDRLTRFFLHKISTKQVLFSKYPSNIILGSLNYDKSALVLKMGWLKKGMNYACDDQLYFILLCYMTHWNSTLRFEQNGRHLTNGTFKWIVLN